MSDWLDGGGYPTEAAHKRIEAWPLAEWQALMTFVHDIWWMPDWGWREKDKTDDGIPVRRYSLSTGGWSGNETLIRALKKNFIFWGTCWVNSHRGGHYIFHVKREVGA